MYIFNFLFIAMFLQKRVLLELVSKNVHTNRFNYA